MLSINPKTVCFIILRAHAFDAKVEGLDPEAEPNRGANSEGEEMILTSAEDDQDPAFLELKSVIDGLNEDEQLDLVTLAWIGRGDYGAAEWAEARGQARDSRSDHTAEYLLGMPLLADYLEEGLAALDYSCEEYEMGRA